MRRSLTLAAFALLVASCGAPQAPPIFQDPPPGAGDGPGPVWPEFDRDAIRADAEAFLGVAEGEVQEGPEIRIVRRGDEHMAVTMDLRPGRMNLELDDDGTGTFVVTRIVVEVPDDEDPLVVE